MAKYIKGKLKGTETHADIFEKIGGASGGARSKLKIKKKKDPEERDPDTYSGAMYVKDSKSPRNPRIIERILNDHGYGEAAKSGRREGFTYEVLNTKGKIRAYVPEKKQTGRWGVSQKTMNNPSIKELMIWLGY